MNARVSARELFRRATALSFREAGAEKELTFHARVMKSHKLKER
jgi:hypothetical protein